MKKKYRISGIDCANCAAKLEAKMNELPEIEQAVLTFSLEQLTVEAEDPDAVLGKLQDLADQMEPGTVIEPWQRKQKREKEHKHHHHHSHEEHPCCDCVEEEEHDHNHYIEEEEQRKGLWADEKKDLLVIGAGIFFFVAGLLLEHFLGAVPMASFVAFAAGYLILGGEIILAAAKNLVRGKVFDENFLMSIATIGAFVIREYPEAVGVMLFYRIGELFEEIAVGRSRKQIMEAVDMRPETVRLVEDGGIRVCDPEEIRVGAMIEVRPGDRIPLDGIVRKGESRLDTSAVTGEPVPVAVQPGSHVLSGCVNTAGLLYLEVEKPLEESMVTRILEAVENAAASKPKIDRFITRFARIYTPFVVVLAILTAVVPSLITGDWNQWVYIALTFLVISCPCALVLSVPLAFFAGIGAGSRKGILFKGGVSLETLSGVKAIVMDKTGTVTEGNFKVASVSPADKMTEEELLTYAACAESRSTHPIAQSIMEEAVRRGIAVPEAEDMTEHSGKGIEIRYQGQRILCGNRKLLEAEKIAVQQPDQEYYGTEVYLAKEGQYIGAILIHDTIKPDSADAVAQMKQQGLWTAMLTGDAEDSAKGVQRETGIEEVYARQMPEDKLKNLEKIRQERGAVMFIGDGINDAPVLAGADVGAAMGSGADAAIEAADVVFMNSRLTAVAESFAISRKTSRIAMQNVVGALAVKGIVMVMGMFGIASMWMAVFADSGVAMLCVLNAVRILFQKKD